jgi:hypothetical protein
MRRRVIHSRMNRAPSPSFGWITALALAAATACGTDSPPPSVDVSGTWTGDVESTAGPPGFEPVFGTYRMTLILLQDGAHVTGTLSSDSAFSGTVAGGVSGDRVTLAVAVAPCGGPGNQAATVSLTGTVRNPGAAVPVLDVAYQGTPCGVADYGTGTLTHP